MKKKLIVLDMDGTLLNDQLEICPETKDTIRRLSKEGHIVMISSGRPFRSIERYYDELGLATPVICLNGMKVIDPRNPNFQPLEYHLKKESVIEISQRCHGILLSCMSESDTKTYQEIKDDYLNWFFPYLDLEIGRLEETLHEDVNTAIWNCKEEDLPKLQKIVNEYYPIVWRKWTGSTYSEAFLDGVNKGTALKFVQQTLNISKEDTIAFGDSINDFEMLNEAGHPFIMKNSLIKKLPEYFHITAYDNNHDGVAFELKKLFKI